MGAVRQVALALLMGLFQAGVWAQDYRLEVIDEPAPSEGVAPEVHKALQPTGLKMIRGQSRTVCEVWLAREWSLRDGFKPDGAVQYPFTPGSFVGLVRFKNPASDFRGQEIPPGVYTLRYALQPEDGNHLGTSATRDFLLMSRASDDDSIEPIEEMQLVELSIKATGTTHPGMMCLLAPPADGTELPSIGRNEDHDFWSIRGSGGPAGDGKKVTIEMVVVGKSEA
jgi:hypothetical protein